jgi:4-alpha-glucanotransferase
MRKQKRFKRGAGILLPVFSLPSDYGIGCFDEQAYSFVDFLQMAGQKYWQILPLNPTGYGDSPYQSCSAFAGNPYFINIKVLCYEEKQKADNAEYIDYLNLYKNRTNILRQIIEKDTYDFSFEYNSFCEENRFWLDNYAIFMAIKTKNNDASFLEWSDEKLKKYDKEALDKFKSENEKEIEFWKKTQFVFFSQWKRIKKYANENVPPEFSTDSIRKRELRGDALMNAGYTLEWAFGDYPALQIHLRRL